MNKNISKIISIFLCLCFLSQQVGFAQVAVELNLASHLSGLRNSLTVDKFRPLHLRYLSYDNLNNNFKLLLDKGDSTQGLSPKGTVLEEELKASTQELLNYFFIGISLPNDSFWVNLRPDSPDNIIDPYLAQTDVGKILLEADLQLKKDTALATSPQTIEGKDYWDKLYKKAEELFGAESITIPTLTRPWIVPGEIIIRESTDNAYIYKATLKVMLEQDYLAQGKGMGTDIDYSFKDERLKKLNEYSSELIRELIIPKLTKDINTAKRYAPLRQVYYSLILAQWFKQKFYGRGGLYSYLIDKRELNNLTSKTPWDKQTFFKAYQDSFNKGEYNLKEPVYVPQGKIIRSYMSGGIMLGNVIEEVAKSGGGIAGSPFKPITIINPKGIPVKLSGGTIQNPYSGVISVQLKGSFPFVDKNSASSAISEKQSASSPVKLFDSAPTRSRPTLISPTLTSAEGNGMSRRTFLQIAGLTAFLSFMPKPSKAAETILVPLRPGSKTTVFIYGNTHLIPFEAEGLEEILYNVDEIEKGPDSPESKIYRERIDKLIRTNRDQIDNQKKQLRMTTDLLNASQNNITAIGLEASEEELAEIRDDIKKDYLFTLKMVMSARGVKDPQKVAEDLFLLTRGALYYLLATNDKALKGIELIPLDNKEAKGRSLELVREFRELRFKLIDVSETQRLREAFSRWNSFYPEFLRRNTLPADREIKDVVDAFKDPDAMRLARKGIDLYIEFLKLSAQRDIHMAEKISSLESSIKGNILVLVGSQHVKKIEDILNKSTSFSFRQSPTDISSEKKSASSAISGEQSASSPVIYTGVKDMVENLPDGIGADYTPARNFIDWLQKVYGLHDGLLFRFYHNQGHNLGTAYIFSNFLKNLKEVSPRDTNIGLLAALMHDFHSRKPEGDKGIPAYVPETLLQIRDLMNMEDYSGPVKKDIPSSYEEKISEDLKNKFRQYLRELFPEEEIKDLYSEIEAMILRTDYASDVGQPKEKYKNAAAEIRQQMDAYLNQLKEWVNLDGATGIINSGYDRIMEQEGVSESDRIWLERQKGIELGYLKALSEIKPERRKLIHTMSLLLEIADQTSFYVLLTATAIKNDIILGLQQERVTASPEGSYKFFFKPQFLNRPEVLAALKTLPMEYRENFVKTMEYFAGLGNELVDWNGNNGNDGTNEDVYYKLGLESAASPVVAQGRLVRMTTQAGRLNHSLSAILELISKLGRKPVIYDIGVGADAVTTGELAALVKDKAFVYGIDNQIPYYSVISPDGATMLFDKNDRLIHLKFAESVETGDSVDKSTKDKAEDLGKGLRAQAIKKGSPEFTDAEGNKIVMDPMKSRETGNLKIKTGDLFAMDAAVRDGALPNADLVRITNVLIPHYTPNDITRALFSLLSFVNEGGYVLIGYTSAVFAGKEESLVYRKTGDRFILEGVMLSAEVDHGVLEFGVSLGGWDQVGSMGAGVNDYLRELLKADEKFEELRQFVIAGRRPYYEKYERVVDLNYNHAATYRGNEEFDKARREWAGKVADIVVRALRANGIVADVKGSMIVLGLKPEGALIPHPGFMEQFKLRYLDRGVPEVVGASTTQGLGSPSEAQAPRAVSSPVEAVFSGEEITRDLPYLEDAAKEVSSRAEEGFKEKVFLLFGIKLGERHYIKRIIPVLKYFKQTHDYVENDPAHIAELIDKYATGEIKLLGVLHTHPYDVTKIITKPGPSWQDRLGEDVLLPERSEKIIDIPLGVVIEATVPKDTSLEGLQDVIPDVSAYFYLPEEKAGVKTIDVLKVVNFKEWIGQGGNAPAASSSLTIEQIKSNVAKNSERILADVLTTDDGQNGRKARTIWFDYDKRLLTSVFGILDEKLRGNLQESILNRAISASAGFKEIVNGIIDHPEISLAALNRYIIEVQNLDRLRVKSGIATRRQTRITMLEGLKNALVPLAMVSMINGRVSRSKINTRGQVEIQFNPEDLPYVKQALGLLPGLDAGILESASILVIQVEPMDGSSSPIKTSQDQSASSPITHDTIGGIDLRALPITTQPVNPGVIPAALRNSSLKTAKGNNLTGTVPSNEELKEEWVKIENMLAAGMTPSSERIKEYLQSCFWQQDFTQEIDKVLSCIADILRLEEERVTSTDSTLKEVLVLLESDKPAEQMQLALAQITAEPRELKTVEQ